jgi:cytochrome c6
MKKQAMIVMAALFGLAGAAAAQAPAVPAVDGKTLFAKNCSACHQVAGVGIPGAFPALKGNPFLQGEAEQVIATVLNGRAGMPAFAEVIADEPLAAILSYARQAWGNKATAVSTETVATVREKLNSSEVAAKGSLSIVH